MLDIAIRGGTIVTESAGFDGDIGIEGDQIALIARSGSLPKAKRTINAEGCLVMPGAVDIHFHVRAPGHAERGTFISETQAAAAGGVTTILEMPISTPGCARVDIFEDRKQLGLAESLVNFGLYGAPGLLKRDEILAMADAGACGFKIFTHAAPKDREDEFLGICLPDEADIYRAMELIKETGLLLSVHAENERLLQLFEGRVRASGRTDAEAFLASRPPIVEAMSVAQMAVLCGEVQTPVHIAHVSCSEALLQLQLAQSSGLQMTGETCPHHLFFSGAEMSKHGPFALIKPPLRGEADQEALWEGLTSGSLLAITTDHAPFTLAEKERGLEDIWRAPAGAAGVEALVPMVLTEALNGRISLEQAIQFICSQPAQLFNLYPQKGTLQPGCDADIVLYDLRDEGVIDSNKWFSKAKATDRLYQGRARIGKVRMTMVNGVVVYESGRMLLEKGGGRFVRPESGD